MLEFMSTARRLHQTYDEYLELLESSGRRFEFCDGQIYAMSGGTPEHAALALALGAVLRQRLKGRCTVFSADLKVRIESTDLSTFPDATVVCGERQTSPIDRLAVTNPTILVEVTSPSTEDYDRGHKLSNYKQLPSLRAVLFVSHRRREITLVERDGARWVEKVFLPGEDVVVAEPACAFPLDEVYEGITLEPPPSRA